MKTSYRIVLTLAKVLFKIFYRHKVYGLENYFKGSAILAANHVSFFDPIAVSISCPEEVSFMARQSLFKSLFGKIIKALNAYPVVKGAGNLAVMKKVCSLLNKGQKVILFPEGTRSLNNEIREIKPGIGVMLSMSKTAILPVYVDGTYKIWGKGRKLPKPFGKIKVVFGTPILWEDYVEMDKKEAQRLVANHLKEALINLKKWCDNGAFGLPP